MKNMTLKNIATVCGGTYYGSSDLYDKEVSGVTIDSRKIESEYLFIPIRGTRVDGHTFIPEVMESGALCTLSEEILQDAAYPYILVDSCQSALQSIAKFYRQSLDIKVVAITGSVGKTSTKESIASVLSTKYKVLKTAGNFNNEIGVPLTVFNLKEEHEIAVLELGISNFGEMHRLADIARPDICILTNIGLSHLDTLGSQEGILKAKSEIFDFLSKDGHIILNADDSRLENLTEVNGVTPHFFSIKKSSHAFATDIQNLGLDGTSCVLHIKEDSDNEKELSIPVTIPIPGNHMVYNVLAAAFTGHLMGLTLSEIKTGIERMPFVSGRTNIIKTDSITIIDDCYNANPTSVRSALDVLASALGRKVAILGDMFDMGENTNTLHSEIGHYAVNHQIDVICCVGVLSHNIFEAASESSDKLVYFFPSKEWLFRELDSIIEDGDTVLVKASHGMEFPEIVDRLKS